MFGGLALFVAELSVTGYDQLREVPDLPFQRLSLQSLPTTKTYWYMFKWIFFFNFRSNPLTFIFLPSPCKSNYLGHQKSQHSLENCQITDKIGKTHCFKEMIHDLPNVSYAIYG